LHGRGRLNATNIIAAIEQRAAAFGLWELGSADRGK